MRKQREQGKNEKIAYAKQTLSVKKRAKPIQIPMLCIDIVLRAQQHNGVEYNENDKDSKKCDIDKKLHSSSNLYIIKYRATK